MELSLAISTSGKSGSLCIARGLKPLYSVTWEKANSHSELLNHLCIQALSLLELTIDDIDFFICDIGPGSFTGVRVATSAVKSFAYKNKKPIVALSSLDILAEAYYDSKVPICSIINAQRNEFYTCFYQVGKTRIKKTKKEKLLGVSEIEKVITKKHLLLGDGAEIFLQYCKKTTKNRCLRPNAMIYDQVNMTHSLPLGHKARKLNKTKAWNSLEALYIRSSSAEEKLRRGELAGVRNYNRRKSPSHK